MLLQAAIVTSTGAAIIMDEREQQRRMQSSRNVIEGGKIAMGRLRVRYLATMAETPAADDRDKRLDELVQKMCDVTVAIRNEEEMLSSLTSVCTPPPGNDDDELRADAGFEV